MNPLKCGMVDVHLIAHARRLKDESVSLWLCAAAGQCNEDAQFASTSGFLRSRHLASCLCELLTTSELHPTVTSDVWAYVIPT